VGAKTRFEKGEKANASSFGQKKSKDEANRGIVARTVKKTVRENKLSRGPEK